MALIKSLKDFFGLKEKWNADEHITDTIVLNKSQTNLLKEASQIVYEKWHKSPTRSLSDSIGVFAFEYDKFLLCAKDYTMGNIVSCHKSLAKLSQHSEKPIIMYLNSAKKFYLFDTAFILVEGRENVRFNETMINFPVQNGIDVTEQFH